MGLSVSYAAELGRNGTSAMLRRPLATGQSGWVNPPRRKREQSDPGIRVKAQKREPFWKTRGMIWKTFVA
jgi:hypothetical protein